MKYQKTAMILFLSCTRLYAADQSIINTTKSGIIIGYEVCQGSAIEPIPCTEHNVTVPAKSKITSPWPDADYSNTPNINAYVTYISSQTGAFKTVKYLTIAERFHICGEYGPNDSKKQLGCGEYPIYLSRPANSFANGGSVGSGLGGAWILKDYDMPDFITMEFNTLGAVHLRS